MARKRSSPASLIATGKRPVIKSAKAKALEADMAKDTTTAGKKRKGASKKGKSRKGALSPLDDESNLDGSSEEEKSEEVKIEYVNILSV